MAAATAKPDATLAAAAAAQWDGWLDERDRAPGEVLADWVKEKAMEGLEVAKGYAAAGLDLAKTRADVARAGGALLDSGGDAARDAIKMKQQCSKAVAADTELMQALAFYGKHYRDGTASQADADTRAMYASRGDLYARAARSLGAVPKAPEMSAVERDAATLVLLSEASTEMRKSFTMMVGPEAYGTALAALRRNDSHDSNSTRAPSSGLQESDMPEPLQNPFPQGKGMSMADRVLMSGGPPGSTQNNLARPIGDAGAMPLREDTTVETKQDERSELAATGGFATRDRVQVWSSSKNEWLDGVVIQAFASTTVCDGYSVPAGSLKVSSSAGTKWIRPGQASQMVRHAPSP